MNTLTRFVFLRLCAVVLALLSWPFLLHAQSSDGTLVGSVTDPTGAAVSGATVKVISSQYGAPRETRTDTVGAYRLEGLQPGSYIVTFSASGFADLQVGSVVLNGSLTTTVDGTLQIGTLSKTVSVEATAGQTIDTQSGQLGESLSAQEINDLPYISLNPAELAMTLPGVQSLNGNGNATTGFTNGIGYSVNGTRPRSNNFLIDGQDDNDYSLSGQAFQPTNYGAVQEFTVLTNSYGAEYGRGGGSVGNYIFKSGSNSFHGGAYEINRDSAFATIPANNKFLGATSNPLDIENTFGFDVGGPVIKDKLFFFGAAQWDRERQRQSGTPTTLPTAAGITTLQTLLPNPNVQLLLNSLSGLSAPQNPDGTGVVTGLPNNAPNCIALGLGPGGIDRGCVQSGLFQLTGVRTAANDRQWNVRLDFHPGQNDTLTASYIRDDNALAPDFAANGGALPQFETQQGGPSQIFRGQWTHVISSLIVNQLRFSYTNIDFSFFQTPATLAGPLANIPEIDFGLPGSSYPSLGVTTAIPQGRGHKTWQGQDALTYTIGRHTIKGGADITFLDVRDVVPFNSRGDLTYLQGGGFTPLGNFVDDFTGQGGSVSKVFGNPVINPSVTIYAPYVEDTWRIKENFTVDLGLRYEYWGTIENSIQFPAINASLGFGIPGSTFPNAFSFPQQPDRNNFGPRIGFAYTPHWGRRIFGDGKTVIRAGYGIFYDGLFTNILDNTAASAPNATGGNVTGGAGRGSANAMASLAAIVPIPNAFTTVDTIANNLKNPMTQQYNLNVQRELPGKLVVTAAYVGTRGSHLFINQDFNPTVNFGPRLNTDFGDIVVRNNAGHSNYNSVQLEVERRFHTDFTVRGSYTYSKFLDNGSEVFTSTGGSSFAQNLADQNADYGPSAFDRRHRLVVSYVWNLPYSSGNWLLKALTNRWEWSGIATFNSGNPDTVFDGFDVNGDGHGGNDRPVVGNASLPITATGIDGAQLGSPFIPGQFYSIPQCLNASVPVCNPEPASDFRFVIPSGGLGNAARNSIYGPGQMYYDTSIQRSFPFHIGRFENQSLTFRTDFFNAFNHPNTFTPGFNLVSPQYDATAATIFGGRQIKFWLKYDF
jgi:carboxypeptidase family protein/TonB-dependent receptor-like protein